jgi:hypothetical protein
MDVLETDLDFVSNQLLAVLAADVRRWVKSQ